jgi:hypothetical protein
VPDSQTSILARPGDTCGAFVAPVYSPYDRQLLRENAERMVGREVELTLGVHGTQWVIRRCTVMQPHCTSCTQPVGRLSCTRAGEAGPTCLDCVMKAGSCQPT